MLEKPYCGWSSLKLKNYEMSISYLNDTPFEWLEAINFGLRSYTTICLKADGEGSGVAYLIIDDIHVILVDGTCKATYLQEEDGYDIIKNIIINIEENLEDWVIWDIYDESDDEIEERRKSLIELIQITKEAYNTRLELQNYRHKEKII